MHERDILLAALERGRPDEREAYLAQACGGDAGLRSRLDALLRASEAQDSFLEYPAIETEVLGPETNAIRQNNERAELRLDFLHASDDADAIGRLGPYTITEVIGRGGMGVVLKARDAKLNRIVALKVLAPELATNPTARKRFQREAHAAAAVVHQHIVTIHAVDEDRLPYLVMECIVGQSLKEKIDGEGHLQLVEILRIGQQVASGLAAAHAHGLIHRDVKPANILLENGIERVRITDFGLARAVDDVGVTRTGEVAGTPQYMSPEQAQGLPMDARSDLFSFGCVLYAMCTGRPPFRAETAFATARRVCEDTPRPIREVNPEIPQWLTDIIERLLQKDAAQRFQSAKEVADVLSQYLAHAQQPAIVPLPGREPVSPQRNPGSPRRQWGLALTALLLVLALALGLSEAAGTTLVVPTIIRIVRGEGTLVIEIADPTVQVALDGKELSIRGAGLQEFRLLPGEHRLHATKDGQPIKDEVVTITRDGRKVVTVMLESPGSSHSPRVATAAEEPVNDLTLLAKLDGHSDLVLAAAFLPDGQRMVSVGRDQTVRVWDVQTRAVLSTLPVEGYLEDADVSANGRFVATAFATSGKAGVAQVWDLEKRKRVCELVQADAKIGCIRFSPDGSQVVTCGNPSGGILWDVATGREVHRFDVNEKGVTSIAEFSLEGRLVAIGAVGRVRLFNRESGDVVGDVQLPQSRGVISLAFAPSGKLLACGQMGGHESLIDVQHCRVTASLPNTEPDAHVKCLRFLNTNRFVLSTRHNTTLRIWDIERLKTVATDATQKGANKRLSVSPDGRYAVSAGGEILDNASKSRKATGDYALRLWQLPESVWPKQENGTSSSSVVPAVEKVEARDELKLLQKLDWHADVVRAVAFLPDGRRVLTVGNDKMARIWDRANRSALESIPIPGQGNLATAEVSPAGRSVAVVLNANSKAVARVWDLEKREVVCEFAPPHAGNQWIRFSPDGTRLVTSGLWLPEAVLWDATTGKELGRFDLGDVRGVWRSAFSPNGRLLALGGAGRVRLFDVESRDVVADVPLADPWNVWDLEFAPNGKTLATGQGGGHVSLIDIDSGRVIKTLRSTSPVHSLRFLGNDLCLLTCSSDATLRVWDLKSERVVAQAATGNGLNHGLFVSPDGRQVMTAGGKQWDDASNSVKDHRDYALRLWQLPESVWPKKAAASPAKDPLSVPTEPGAFVLLAAGKERKFETLAEAVKLASAGDTIEVRGNGPFVCQPINLRGTELTIRAADGFRPVIETNLEVLRGAKALLQAEAPLVLEGLEFRCGERKPNGWQVLLQTSQSLHAANCRFVSRNMNAHIQAGGDAELRNCEFLAPEGYLNSNGAPSPSLAIVHSPGKKLVTDNCLLTSAIQTRQGDTAGRGGFIQLTRNTFRTPSSAFRFRVNDGQEGDAGGDETEKVLRVEAAGNLFHTRWLFDFGQWRKVALPPVDAEAYVARIVGWKGERNIYTVADSFLILTQSTPYAVNSPTLPAGLTGWAQLWGRDESGSLQGDIRCLGGNLNARLEAPEKITPDDFRLRPDSAGYRADPDGKDLGADVDLVGPGPAYERWKKTPEYQVWLKDSGQLCAEVPQPEPGAFVLLAAGKERKFDTLAEAVQSASSGDTIEIRGNGPFVSQPVKITGTPLTLRAAPGFRPVIRLDLKQAQPGDALLTTNGTLCVEGIELQAFGPLPQERKPNWSILLHPLGANARLFVTNCRFVCDQLDGVPIRAAQVALLDVRNSQFVSQSCLTYSPARNSRITLHHNLIAADPFGVNFPVFVPDSGEVTIDLDHNTLVAPNAVQLYLDFMPEAVKEPDQQANQAIRFRASGNLFQGISSVLRFEQSSWFMEKHKALAAAEMESLLRAMVDWSGERNGFASNTQMVEFAALGKPLPSTQRTDSVAQWDSFWGAADSKCIQGQIRFAGGDLLTKAVTTPELLSAENYRLRADSVGYRAGSNDKDLGADVDRVGPGQAYEQWKKKPEYQDWLKASGQVN